MVYKVREWPLISHRKGYSMLDNIRKIQQRAIAIDSKYNTRMPGQRFSPRAWLDSAHTSYLDAIAHQWSPNIRRDEIAHQCALPASPCLDLECLGFDTREQKK